MSLWRKVILVLVSLTLLAAAFLTWYLATYDAREPSRLAYAEHCAGCHGKNLQGINNGPSLVGANLVYGDSTAELISSIRDHSQSNNAAKTAQSALPNHGVKAMSLYVSERRQELPTIPDSQIYRLPSESIASQHHDFRVEHVAALASAPYSMAPLPNGEVLVTEKVRGLSLIDQRGQQSPLILNAPPVWGEFLKVRGSQVGLGMMLDVELHPDYSSNGWIYLSHTHRCQFDCGSLVPQTMARVVRGKISEGSWHSEEVVWSVDTDFYTVIPDNVAAGRLAFDQAGHLYISIGGKASYSQLHEFDTPYGKIHRVNDDGTVPKDNPFWQPPEDRAQPSTRHTVWSFGHRTTQGLAAQPTGGEIWASEMGPRGGDEINRITPGGNYGWPLYTEGLDYDGEPVRIGQELGLDFPLTKTIPPTVDFTPAPSLSSFTFHSGQQFPNWRHDLLVGSLRARTLFRIRMKQNQAVELGKLVEHLGRIRDVEMGPQGLVYLLVEHQHGGSLLRLVPLKTDSFTVAD